MSRARSLLHVVGRPVDAVGSRHRRGPSVLALIYHRVGRRTASPVDLPLSAFERQLDLVTDRVIDLDEAAASLRGASVGEAVQPPSIVLTFDDGTADWADVVMPALVERRLPAVFYVSTDYVERGRPFPGDGRPMSWTGLSDLASTGLATIASHTHTHRVLARVSPVEAVGEIDRSIGLIEDRLGRSCRHFAYPRAVAPSPAAEVVVRRRFATAALAGNRVNIAGRTDLHRLGRHAVTVADGEPSFRRTIAGGRRVEGRLRELRDARRR
jgi:peptidoglycan/xylan/chitin deacetylase (PgdA/CDA1 family)